MTYAGKPVVAGSRLGLTLRQTGPLASGFRVLDVKRASRDETYTLVAGKTREARDRSEEMTVSLERAGEKPVRLDVVFRAFDDGAAFRYVLPQQAGLERVEVVSEDTRFRFLADHKAWVLQLASFTTSNEREFVPMPLLGIKPESIVGPPLTIEAGDGLVVALAEANLRRWSGLHFARVEGGNDSRQPTLVTKLAPLPSQPDIVVRGALPLVSPWRVLMLGREAGRPRRVHDPHEPRRPQRDRRHLVDQAGQGRLGLVERARRAERAVEGRHEQRDVPATSSTSPPSSASSTCSSTPAGTATTGTAGPTSRRPIPEMDVPGLAAYAKEKNVGLLVWLNWEAVREQMDVAFPLYEKWGLAGVKIDYMDRKDQEIVAFYQRARARRRSTTSRWTSTAPTPARARSAPSRTG